MSDNFRILYISFKELLAIWFFQVELFIIFIISHIAATDKILKTDSILYYTLNVLDHSSGSLQSKAITS